MLSSLTPPLPVAASTSRPRPFHCKVHAGPFEGLWHEEGGGVGERVPQEVPADVGTVRMSDSRWAPCVDAGGAVEGARGGQS